MFVCKVLVLGSALHASGRVRATGRRHRAHCLRACYNSEFVGFRKCGEKFSSRSSSSSSSFRFTVVPPKSWLPIRSPSVARCPSGTHCLFVVAIAIYLPLALHLGRMRTRAHSAPLHRLLTYNQWQRQTTRRPQRRRATRERAKSSSSVPPRINTDYIRSCRCRVVRVHSAGGRGCERTCGCVTCNANQQRSRLFVPFQISPHLSRSTTTTTTTTNGALSTATLHEPTAPEAV